ncbi:hypothetical protein KC19_4G182200 [Ceratodon purpureus]|uniref:Uncharacterized protein n=1 Tax=Ceratodon purpureus TaxID=3225 RepID=A0A8T0IC87_CERPU|nr:hypothetical protein KC19_4G182200 [Ceratodon purpureus]
MFPSLHIQSCRSLHGRKLLIFWEGMIQHRQPFVGNFLKRLRTRCCCGSAVLGLGPWKKMGSQKLVDWPELQRRKFRKLTDVKGEGSAGCYWKPESKTNATFDAVCTSIGAPLGTSAALQMTISEEHGIKHDGLDKLLRAMPSVKRFYWVVPALIFEDFKKQRFKNKDSELRIQAISDPVSRVEQWALELPLNHFHPGAVQS